MPIRLCGQPAFQMEWDSCCHFLYTEIRADIVYAFFEMRLAHMTILSEVFLEVYNLFVLAWEEGGSAG